MEKWSEIGREQVSVQTKRAKYSSSVNLDNKKT